jgi:AcrR family transcriptional regulator
MPRDRTNTRARLFESAASLIGAQGLHATTIDQIVERAGVAKGTVYYHFRSKDELFQALLVEGLRQLADTLRAQASDGPSRKETLAGIIRAEVEYIAKYEAFARLVMSQLWQSDSLWNDEAIRVLHEDVFAVIREVLEAGRAEGEFRANLKPSMAAPVIFGMVATATLGRSASAASSAAAEAWPYLLDMTLGTVCVAPTVSGESAVTPPA